MYYFEDLIFLRTFSVLIYCKMHEQQSRAVVATLLVPALRRQRPVDLCEYEASLDYKASYRITSAVIQRKNY